MKKVVYINGLGIISAQDSLGNKSIDQFQKKDQFNCIEPNYKDYIPPIKARRMSRILKMSYVAAVVAMKESGKEVPQCINVATSLGCLQDTTKFLLDVNANDEQSAKPTSFINSTHNTIAGLLAISFKSKGQNFTFSHTDFNFEHALLDSFIQLREEEVEDILLGGVDELTEETQLIKNHLGLQNQGEGASFITLSSDNNKESYAKIIAIDFAYEIKDLQQLENSIGTFLEQNKIRLKDLSTVYSGVEKEKLPADLLGKKPVFYKDFCGDYLTSPAFGLSMASMEVKANNTPILIINRSNNSYSFILLSN